MTSDHHGPVNHDLLAAAQSFLTILDGIRGDIVVATEATGRIMSVIAQIAQHQTAIVKALEHDLHAAAAIAVPPMPDTVEELLRRSAPAGIPPQDPTIR